LFFAGIIMSAIQLDCTCGKSYRLKKDVQPGRTIRCPACGNGLKVPAPAPVPEPVGVFDSGSDEFEALLASAAAGPSVAPPAANRPVPPPVPAPLPMVPPPLQQQPTAWATPPTLTYAQAQARQKTKPQPRVVFERGWFGSVNSGAIGGILMMIIAAAWFFVGLSFNRIFFYPPILFVIGAIAVIKGVLGGN
jgi:hypothetical protein